MKFLFTVILLLHGAIHFMGFVHAFHLSNIEQFTKDISKPMGGLWLLTGVLFTLSAIFYFAGKEYWSLLAVMTVVLSQVLIFIFWADAKYGTIANIIILTIAIPVYAQTLFENAYKKDVVTAQRTVSLTKEMITAQDLIDLPLLIQNHLKTVGVLGKPKVKNFRIVFTGQMRDRGKDWFEFTSEQYNFIEEPTRLFFMKAKVSGMPTTGYHRYTPDGASMHIKLASMFTVARVDSPEMFPTETVTFFNDLCLFAPAALIDKRFQWRVINERSVEASFTTGETTITAVLNFNEAGQLINFVSHDRYSVSEMRPFPFSTPVKDYQEINGHTLPTYGEAVWQYPEGDFVYGKFKVKSIEYNVVE